MFSKYIAFFLRVEVRKRIFFLKVKAIFSNEMHFFLNEKAIFSNEIHFFLKEKAFFLMKCIFSKGKDHFV